MQNCEFFGHTFAAPPADRNGAKIVALARFGNYEVRLVEFVQIRPTDARPMWLELCSHET